MPYDTEICMFKLNICKHAIATLETFYIISQYEVCKQKYISMYLIADDKCNVSAI